jgi:hypothetical protein
VKLSKGQLSLLLLALLPMVVHADLYECKKGKVVAYQQTPCDGGNVQTDHIEDRDPDYFLGCYAGNDHHHRHFFEVRANGSGTYRLIDQRNPLGDSMIVKHAGPEEVSAVSDGLRITINKGLSQVIDASAPPPTSSERLYGVYQGVNAAGHPVTLLYMGGRPQIVDKASCPAFP